MSMNTQKATLMARRADLVGHLRQVETALDETPAKDFEDFASERQGDEVLEALGLAELQEVRRIDAALGRISDGTYGFCLGCKEAIPAARLAAVPDTALCLKCAAHNF